VSKARSIRERADELNDDMQAQGMMEAQASYLNRGRRFAPITDAELQALWQETFRSFTRDPLAGDKLQLDDTLCEMALRELRPDTAPVRSTIKEAAAMILSEVADGNSGLHDMIQEYLDKRGQPS
jgi:hypothetical protein